MLVYDLCVTASLSAFAMVNPPFKKKRGWVCKRVVCDLYTCLIQRVCNGEPFPAHDTIFLFFLKRGWVCERAVCEFVYLPHPARLQW